MGDSQGAIWFDLRSLISVYSNGVEEEYKRGAS